MQRWRHLQQPKLMLLSLAIAMGIMGALAVGFGAASQERKDETVLSHLTLYVSEPLLVRGGTVIVAAIPIPAANWQELTGDNPAAQDEANVKRASLTDDDRLFGAFVYGPVSYVEMFYPEGGSFGFNLVPDYRLAQPMTLSTERILVGSGGWFDRKTQTAHDWPDVSVIYVDGTSASKQNSRLVRAYGNNILNLGPRKQVYAGAIVYTPDNAQILEGTFGEYQ
jgi:hypothetical protein